MREKVSTHQIIKRDERDPMGNLTSKTTAVFSGPFSVPSFEGTLPAGEYDIETIQCPPPDHRHPEIWKASVMLKMNPQPSVRKLARTLTLTVSLAELDEARAKDKPSGKELSDYFLEEMLADPMVRLVMDADSVSETQLRHIHSPSRTHQTDIDVLDPKPTSQSSQDNSAIKAAENEGMAIQTD
jgi:hypothetical protein